MKEFPLDNVTVIDFTQILAGPFCTMLLADMGANVIKIEKPNGGDDTRRFGPPFENGESVAFIGINRNKRSMVLDLKTEIGIEYSTDRLLQEHDAICLAVGSTVARDLPVPGRELKGVHFAMEYLTQQNRLSQIPGYKPDELISAEGKMVVILEPVTCMFHSLKLDDLAYVLAMKYLVMSGHPKMVKDTLVWLELRQLMVLILNLPAKDPTSKSLLLYSLTKE